MITCNNIDMNSSFAKKKKACKETPECEFYYQLRSKNYPRPCIPKRKHWKKMGLTAKDVYHGSWQS